MLDALTRLPGVLCETKVPNLGQQPLRLDVAGFVGLAERGPLDVPVLVEDFSQYRLIFGGDLPLARDEGQPLYAQLPRAVEAFFENGGRRCYVVRVAGPGNRPNRFQIPGLLYQDEGNGWQPVVVPAAWPGRWSDLVSVATSMNVRPLELRAEGGKLDVAGSAVGAGSLALPLRLPAANALRPGDLLRLYLQRTGASYQVYGRVATVVETATLAGIQLFGVPVLVRLQAGATHIFRSNPAAVAPNAVAQLTASGWSQLPFAGGDYNWSAPTPANAAYRLTMPLAAEVKIESGDLLRLTGPGGTSPLFFNAERVQRADVGGGDVRLVIDGDEALQREATLADEVHTLTQVELVSFDLRVREGETTLEQWPDRRFGAGPDHWIDLLQPAIEREQVNPAAFSVDDFSGRSLRLGALAGADPLPLPLGMAAASLTYFGARSDLLPTGKDGLDSYDPRRLFLDEALETAGIRNLPAVANDLLHLGPAPRRLRGLHSLLPVEEVALIAVPDLVHVGWEAALTPTFPAPETPDEEEEVTTGFHDCPPEEAPVAEEEAVPVLTLDPESATPAPSSQAWLEKLPEQLNPADHDDDALLDVQRALIRLCAARADLVALLSLPHHFQTEAAVQWQQALTTTPDFFDGNPLSYAAAYHGWLAIREPASPALAPLRYLPPDGFVAGMIAAREIRRGAWIAPANVPLQNAVDWQPAFADEAWATLYSRQLNIVRRRPDRYLLLSALTLDREHQYRQLNVRRLLILLRKLALREGQRYVFETNNERFQALVQTYFEEILNRILERGGLQAFQVVTNEEINTQNDYDNGRFLIALKVAPTLPIEFITITMLRSGDDALTILER